MAKRARARLRRAAACATTVHATPGKATRWQASGHFTAPPGMRCVLRGVTTR
jgi:hypothetical protein